MASAITPGMVEFYDGENFKGAHITYQVGQTVSYKHSNWNDRVSSFKIGEGARLLMCRDVPCGHLDGGESTVIIGPHESSSMPNFNNVLSYFSIEAHHGFSAVLFTSP